MRENTVQKNPNTDTFHAVNITLLKLNNDYFENSFFVCSYESEINCIWLSKSLLVLAI